MNSKYRFQRIFVVLFLNIASINFGSQAIITGFSAESANELWDDNTFTLLISSKNDTHCSATLKPDKLNESKENKKVKIDDAALAKGMIVLDEPFDIEISERDSDNNVKNAQLYISKVIYLPEFQFKTEKQDDTSALACCLHLNAEKKQAKAIFLSAKSLSDEQITKLNNMTLSLTDDQVKDLNDRMSTSTNTATSLYIKTDLLSDLLLEIKYVTNGIRSKDDSTVLYKCVINDDMKIFSISYNGMQSGRIDSCANGYTPSETSILQRLAKKNSFLKTIVVQTNGTLFFATDDVRLPSDVGLTDAQITYIKTHPEDAFLIQIKNILYKIEYNKPAVKNTKKTFSLNQQKEPGKEEIAQGIKAPGGNSDKNRTEKGVQSQTINSTYLFK